MSWYKLRFVNKPLGEAAVQNRFATLFIAAGGPEEMLTVSEHHDVGDYTIWVRLPDRYCHAFEEFELSKESTLPRSVTLLVGSDPVFRKMFEFDV